MMLQLLFSEGIIWQWCVLKKIEGGAIYRVVYLQGRLKKGSLNSFREWRSHPKRGNAVSVCIPQSIC